VLFPVKSTFLLIAIASLVACGSGGDQPKPLPTVGEIHQLILDSNGTDTDRDGIPDDVELHPALRTSPDRDDSDHDGVFDCFEVFGRSFLFIVTKGEAGKLYENDRILDGNENGTISAIDPSETGTEFMEDADGDGVPNFLEYYGYRYDWPSGKFVFWSAADRAAHPELEWYRTDPLQPSTDQDAYPDGMEVSKLKMDIAVEDPGGHPLVPAYPNIVVTLEGYTVTLNEEVSYEDGKSLSSGTTWSRETKSESSFSREYGQEIGGEAGFDGGWVLKAHGTLNFGQTATNTTGTATTIGSSVNEEISWSRARSYNRSEAAKIKLYLKVENQGSAPASNVVPTVNLRIGGTNVASFSPADFEIEMLMPGGVFPEEDGLYWVVDSTPGGPLMLTEWELKALESGAPVNLAVTQLRADVMRLDETGAWQPAGDVNEHVARCKEVAASFFAEVAPGRYLHRQVYADQGPTAPKVTLRDALKWGLGAVEEGDDLFLEHEDKDGIVERVQLTSQTEEGWSIHMDHYTRGMLEDGQHPLDVRLHRDAHIELVAPRGSIADPPNIYTAYVVPLDDGWDVVVCASDYDGIKDVHFIDKLGNETKMEPDGRGPWFFSCRLDADYVFSTYGAEGVRVMSLNPDAHYAQRPVEVIHTIESKPPVIGRLRFDGQRNRLEVKVEPGGELPEDAIDEVLLYHPEFLNSVTKAGRDGYIPMIETIYWFEDPFVYECVIPGGWREGMRVVAKTKGGKYATLDVGTVPSIVPFASGSAMLGTRVHMTWPPELDIPDDWNVPMLDLDQPGFGRWAHVPVPQKGWIFNIMTDPPVGRYHYKNGWPQGAVDDFNAHFPAGDVFVRSKGEYYHWTAHLIGIQQLGMKAEPTGGMGGPAYYEALTVDGAELLSGQMVPGGLFTAEENGVYVIKTDAGRYAKLIIRRIKTWNNDYEAVLPTIHWGTIKFDYTVFRKAGDGTLPQPFHYDPDTYSWSNGTEIERVRPSFSGSGDPADYFEIAPALPAGLEFDTQTGAVSGKPTENSAATDFTVTATNTKGSREATINIEVLQPPSNLVYGGAPFAWETGEPITPQTPQSNGTIDECTISPALPAGLSMDHDTGTISGTPTEVTGPTDYTVTASNRTGASTTDVITIETPLGAPRDLSYAVTSASYTVGAPIVPNAPTVTNPVTLYEVSPALPSGLTIHATSGIISGTPDAVSASTEYTITATNATDSTTTTITIEVN
jgi:hypothetical protein